MDNSVLKWLRNQNTTTTIRITLDRLYLIDELIKQGEFKSRSRAIEQAIDELLREYYPELENAKAERLGDFVRADVLKEESEA